MRTTLYNILTALFAAMVVAGAGVIVGVWAVPQWDAYQAETTVSQMQASSSSSSSTPEGQTQLADAHDYNDGLAGAGSGSGRSYANQLNLADAQAIGWLEIPSIDLRRPVYHYDSEEVLMAGLGHIEGTSLPVGGTSTHCCVTGHSGMTGSRMFDDLRKVEVGDIFVFWTLGDPYAYKVYDIEVVKPEDTSGLLIQPGRDLATLITCTPYGINSHRLLVHGERTDYVPEEIAAAEQHPTSDRLWVLGAGIVAAAAAVGALLYVALGGSTLKLVAVANAAGGTLWAGAGAGADAAARAPKIELRPFGRARVSADGAKLKASWSRDGSDIVIDLHRDSMNELIATADGSQADVQIPGQIRAVKQPDGTYLADVLVDGARGTLTFTK